MTDLKYFILKLMYNSENYTTDLMSILNSKIATPCEIQTAIDSLSSAPTIYVKNIPCIHKYTLTNEGICALESEQERRCQITKDEKNQKFNKRINYVNLLINILVFILGYFAKTIVELIPLILSFFN